jgi:hypothetical protein
VSVPILLKILGSLLTGAVVFSLQTPASALQTSPPPPASAPQTSPPPPDGNRLYMVQIGPISDRDRAAAIAKELSVGGFSQTKVTMQAGFRVVSELLPRSVADGLVATLAGRGIHSQVEPLGGDTVQLLFGIFTTRKEAETLAQRIGAAGCDAWVRGGAVYTLQLGPYPQSSVETISRIAKSGAPDATVTADPVASQTPPPASAPQMSPPASVPPATTQAPQGSTGTSSRPANSEPSQPAAQTPSQGASRGPSQADSLGPVQGTVVAPSRLVPAAASPAPGAAPLLIIPGQSLGPVRLGMPVREETVRLGASKGTAELDDGTMMYRWFEPPSNSGIGVRTAQNGTVLRVWVLNDERYRTKEGLHIGNTEAEVRAALGDPTIITINVQGKTRTLVYESLGLWFTIILDQHYRFYNAVFDIGIMAKK